VVSVLFVLKTRVRATGGGIKKLVTVTVGALLGATLSLGANAAINTSNGNFIWDGVGNSHTLETDSKYNAMNPNTGNLGAGDGINQTQRNEVTIKLNSHELTAGQVTLGYHYFPANLAIEGQGSFIANDVAFAGTVGDLAHDNKPIDANFQKLSFTNVDSIVISRLRTVSAIEGTYGKLSLNNSSATVNGFTASFDTAKQNTATLNFDLVNNSSLTFNKALISENGVKSSYTIKGEGNILAFNDCGSLDVEGIMLKGFGENNVGDTDIHLKLQGNSTLELGSFVVSLAGTSTLTLDASEATSTSVFDADSFRIDVGQNGTSQSTFIGRADQIFTINPLVLRSGINSFTIDGGKLDIEKLHWVSNASNVNGTIGNLIALNGGRLNLTGTDGDHRQFAGKIVAYGNGSSIQLNNFDGINFTGEPVDFVVQDGGSISLFDTQTIGSDTNRALLTLNGSKQSVLNIYGDGHAHSSANYFKLSDSFETHTIGSMFLKGADVDIDANGKNFFITTTLNQGTSKVSSNFSVDNFNQFFIEKVDIATDNPEVAIFKISNGSSAEITTLNFTFENSSVIFEDVDQIYLSSVSANVDNVLSISSDTKQSQLHLGEASENLSLNFGGASAKKLSVYAADTKLASLTSGGNLSVSGVSGLQSLNIKTLDLAGDASFTDLTSLNVTDQWKISGNTVNLDLGNEFVGGKATFATNNNSDSLAWNLSSKASDLSAAEGFSTIEFGDNIAGANSTITLRQGGWLAVGNQPGLEETTTALKAFAQNGNAKTSILSFSNGAPLQVGEIVSDGPLMVLAKAEQLNNTDALVDGGTVANPTLSLNSDVGFYLVSNFAGIDADAKVLVTKDYGNWSQYNGQEVGADNIFTKWEVVTDEQGNLSYQLKEVKTVTETLPNIIPSNGFGEILGNKNDRGGFDQGTGIGLISPEPAKIPSVGSILVGSIMDYGASDTGLISDLANTFASFATSGGVQAGAMGMSSMVSQSLDRHYSYTTTVGVNPLDTHVAGAGDLWVDALYRHDQTRGLSNGAGEYGNKTNLRGIVLGQDITLDNAWTVGAVVNYIDGQTDSDKSTIDITNKSKSYGVSAWAGYACPGNFSLKTTASYARGDNDLTANMPWEMSESFKNIYSTAWNELTDVEKAGLPETIDTGIKASMDTKTVTLAARVEHLIQTPYVDIIPHIAVQYDRVKSDSYTMKIGGVGAIDTKVETMNTFSVPVGVAFAKSQTDAKTGWNSRVMADVSATPRFGDTEATVRSNFHGYNAVDKGKVEVMDDVSYGASVGAQVFKKNFAVGFNAGLEGSGKGTSASANVNAVWRF